MKKPFPLHLARERLKHVVAIVEYSDEPNLCMVVFDKAHREDWMALGAHEFADVVQGNEWVPSAGLVGKRALGLDVNIHPEDLARFGAQGEAPELPMEIAPETLYQCLRQKVARGEIPRYQCHGSDDDARQAIFDAIDATCKGEETIRGR